MADNKAFSDWGIRSTTKAGDTVVGLSDGRNVQFTPEALRQGLATSEELESKLDADAEIPQSQVSGLTEQLNTALTGPVESDRVQGLDDVIKDAIADTPNILNKVSAGPHEW